MERAWLTIDSDLYVWRYEDCSDLAYFDGLGDAILSVALLEPKKDIFRPHIKHLLCLTTAIEIVLLGVSFGRADGECERIDRPFSRAFLTRRVFTFQTIPAAWTRCTSCRSRSSRFPRIPHT